MMPSASCSPRVQWCGDEKSVAEKEGPKETVKQPEEKGTGEPAKPTEPEKAVETPKRDLAGEGKTLAADAKGKPEAGQVVTMANGGWTPVTPLNAPPSVMRYANLLPTPEFWCTAPESTGPNRPVPAVTN